MKKVVLFPFVMIMLVGITLVHIKLLRKFYNVDFTGLLYFVILTNIVQLVTDAKDLEQLVRKI